MSDALALLTAGVWVDDRNLTLGSWLQTWLTLQEQAGRSPKTLANYRGHVRDVWDPCLGHVLLRDLRRIDLEQVLVDLLTPSRDDGAAHRCRSAVLVRSPVSPGSVGQGNVGRRVDRRARDTVEGYRRTIRAALSVAQRRGLIAVNPAQGRLDALPAASSPAPNLLAWEPAQIALFLEHVDRSGDRLAALYEVAAYTGLRRGELCGLRWSDLDEDAGGLTVRHNLVEVARGSVPAVQRVCPICETEHTGLVVKDPKSRAGNRWVPLAQPARSALRQHRHAQDTDRRQPSYREHDLMFCTPNGDPLRPGRVSARFAEHVRTSGLPMIRLHDLRHSACSLLLAGGVPIEVVQMILGHAHPATTRRIYAHLIRETTAAQVEQATDLLTRHRSARAYQVGD